MQLFVLDKNPSNAVEYLADTHVIKMCLETAQILSTITAIKGIPLHPDMPKPYNVNHPVIKAIDTPEKLNWVLVYNIMLQCEYTYRFHKDHKYANIVDMYMDTLYDYDVDPDITEYDFSKNFKGFTVNNTYVVGAYRDYYKFKKSQIKNWKYTNREEPWWLKDVKKTYEICANVSFDVYYQVEAANEEEAEDLARELALDEHNNIDPDSLFCHMDTFDIYEVNEINRKD